MKIEERSHLEFQSFPWRFSTITALVLVVLSCTLDDVRSTSADGELISGDYCHAEAFRASCNDDDDEEADSSDTMVTGGPQSISAVSGSTIAHIHGRDLRVIVIEKALYGRMELGRCVEVDVMGHLGCHTDVLSLVDRRCSGRRRCEIRVPDAELESTRPCLRELKTYLHVSYRCVSATVTAERCRWPTDTVLPVSRPSSGYIASVVTSDTPWCADGRLPWLIQAEPWQNISLTLYDFFATANSALPLQSQPTTLTDNGDTDIVPPTVRRPIQKGNMSEGSLVDQTSREADVRSIHSKRRCREHRAEYAIVQDGEEGNFTVLCGGSARISSVYLYGNVVRIWIRAGIAPKDFQRFLIAYSVIGCADPVLSSYTWFRRSSNGHAISGCLSSDVVWPLDCLNGTWSGPSRNCSAPATVVTRDASSTWRQSRADNDNRNEDYGVDNGDEKELAAQEPSMVVTHTSDYFILVVVSGLVGSVVLLIIVSVSLARLAMAADRRYRGRYGFHDHVTTTSSSPRPRGMDLGDDNVDAGGGDGCGGKMIIDVNTIDLGNDSRPELIQTLNVIGDRGASCQYGRLITTPTSGRYHVRRHTEEFEATTTTESPTVMTSSHRVKGMTLGANYSRRQQLPRRQTLSHQQHCFQPIPSVSAVVSGTRKTPSLPASIMTTPAEDVDVNDDSSRNSRAELLHTFQPYSNTDTVGNRFFDTRRQRPTTSSSSPSPAAVVDEFLTFAQSGPF